MDTILVNLDRMVHELNDTLGDHRLAQGSANESIDDAYKRSTHVFHELNPDKGMYVLEQRDGTPRMAAEQGTVTKLVRADPPR